MHIVREAKYSWFRIGLRKICYLIPYCWFRIGLKVNRAHRQIASSRWYQLLDVVAKEKECSYQLIPL
jgi:hypothetical protein